MLDNKHFYQIKEFGVEASTGEDISGAARLAFSKLGAICQKDGKPRTMLLELNGEYIMRNVKLPPLVNLFCIGGRAIFKRPDASAETEENAKWWRILIADGALWKTSADFEHRSQVHNIEFDGNYNNSGWTRNTYNQEQASCFILYNPSASKKDKRNQVKFELSNVVTRDSVSDGIHVVQNIDIIMTNMHSTNCFRGGLTISGGNSTVRGDGFYHQNSRFDLEIDSYGSMGSYASSVYIDNYFQDLDGGTSNEFRGGCDIGGVGTGGVLKINNMNVGTKPFRLAMYGSKFGSGAPSTFLITNSRFTFSRDTIVSPTNGLIKNTVFVIDNDDRKIHGLDVLSSYNGYLDEKGSELLFEDVKFVSKDKTKAITNPLISFKSKTANHKVALGFKNCDFTEVVTTDYLFGLPVGGAFNLYSLKMDSAKLLYASGVYGANDKSSKAYPFVVKLGRIEATDKLTDLLVLRSTDKDNRTNTLEFLDNYNVTDTHNLISGSYPYDGSVNIVRGYRIVTGENPPTIDTKGFSGDRYQLKKPISEPLEWILMQDKVSHKHKANWRLIRTVADK